MFLKKIPIVVSFVRFLRRLAYKLARDTQISNYINKNNTKKLHIGSGSHSLHGWLNTDLFPLNRKIMFLDATRTFPFNDRKFDYIFSEHQIEHIHYREAITMLSECYRVLKIGGTIRISTPNLKFFVTPFDNPEKLSYVDFIMDSYIRRGFHKAINYPPPINLSNRESFVINDIFYNYEHKFIYDINTLSDLLESVGFTGVRICKAGCSSDKHLSGIDRVSDGIEALATIIVEADKSPNDPTNFVEN